MAVLTCQSGYLPNIVVDHNWGCCQCVDRLSAFRWLRTNGSLVSTSTRRNGPKEIPGLFPPSLAAKVARFRARSLCLFPRSRSLSLSLSFLLALLAICRFWAAFCVRLCGAVGALHGDLSLWVLPLFFFGSKDSFSICSTKALLPAASAVFSDHCSTYTECLERLQGL
jgi:hypothetical protein